MSTGIDLERAAKIARRNDIFRRGGFGFMLTSSIERIPDLLDIIGEVRMYTDFDEYSDPHYEHDFGLIHWYGKKIIWKIDYYDRDLEYACDPLARNCQRVLTVMLAGEY